MLKRPGVEAAEVGRWVAAAAAHCLEEVAVAHCWAEEAVEEHCRAHHNHSNTCHPGQAEHQDREAVLGDHHRDRVELPYGMQD